MKQYNIHDVEAAAYMPLIKLMRQHGHEVVLQHIYHKLISGQIDQVEDRIPDQLVQLGITHQGKFKEAFLRDLIDYYANKLAI